MKIALAAQMRELDRLAIKERGIPSVLLMERAAQGVADEVIALAGKRRPHSVVIFCGTGNNGGDGIGAAYLLLEEGWEVHAYLVGKREKMTPDAREMERRLIDMGGVLHPFTADDTTMEDRVDSVGVLVDALFGIGLNTIIHGDAQVAIMLMNRSPAPTVAADISSGVEADTGCILGTAVEAARTVTFTLPKVGNYVGQGGICAGKVRVVSIGIEPALVSTLESDMECLTSDKISLPCRFRGSHKGDFGRAYILGGCVGYTGAPVFAAKAAVRTGAGLVSVGVPNPIWGVVANKLLEAMPHPLPAGKDGMLSLEALEAVRGKLERCDVCLVGPGLGTGGGVASVVRHLLREITLPVVLDADGINALAGHIDVLDERGGYLTVLTPHDGEFARLLGRPIGANRLEEVREFARAHGCCLVLKGYRTITAFPNGSVYINTTGNPGMATGGSGDALAGMILGLLAQGFPAKNAVPLAVFCHGWAGDLAAREYGEYSMTPSDLVERIPAVFQQIVEEE